ncbi:3-hydroxyacyl-CoA dehydrogenase NAD-binding domain-containing protein [Chitinophagaceae bacterium LB-8]|uniref:3-hydroxyacyl-CoA dehydrogenase NAD-binding domain-containing protein n=1 Tax=Paraflavisolibacter caeni TaxID=2982496 RepID=A0A9X3BEU5_9BACT|nr:3-hydroxyacyl-CoA dehydrogenase NAD-binding domain-containing protein [Paraflavisolibacter caeni]MCU7547674.1 3-hydroxyacyl-CoA dehydrogenase NAD-binding domain-containing protein [Paraflavisolibacter caeni]
MHLSTICICGAGTMGSGIAQVAASAGFKTILYEVNGHVLQNAANKLQKDLAALVEKGKIDEAARANIFNNLTFTSELNHCVADLIIEAIVENMEAKAALLQQLAKINKPETVLASNTSSLSITQLARQVIYPERVAGLHFFNPAPIMKLVEIVKGEQTGDEIVQSLVNIIQRMNKIPVVCKDAPGFIVNRIARPFYIEALRLVEEGIADYPTIDRLIEARGFKMGPFHLMDLIGNDINYAVSCSVYDQLNQPDRLKPSYLQKEKVETGALGRKTKKGFYNYDAP